MFQIHGDKCTVKHKNCGCPHGTSEGVWWWSWELVERMEHACLPYDLPSPHSFVSLVYTWHKLICEILLSVAQVF